MNNYFSRLAKLTGINIDPRQTVGSATAPPVPSQLAPLEVESMRLVESKPDPTEGLPANNREKFQDITLREKSLPEARDQLVERRTESMDLPERTRGISNPAEREATPSGVEVYTSEILPKHSQEAVNTTDYYKVETDTVIEPTPPLHTNVTPQEKQSDVRVNLLEEIPPLQTTMAPEAAGEINVVEEKIISPEHSLKPLVEQQPTGQPRTVNGPVVMPEKARPAIAFWKDVYEWINIAPTATEDEKSGTENSEQKPSLESSEMGRFVGEPRRPVPEERAGEPEIQDFQLSIGNISLVIESPPAPLAAQVASPGRAAEPVKPRREVSSFSRHYIRVR